MKILSLKYEDTSTDWKLDLMEFNPHLTLLVGASGVGKTRILKAILNLQKISQGFSANGLKWEIEFYTNKKDYYKWSGSFENRGFIPDFVFRLSETDDKDKSKIETESLSINNELIVSRDSNGIMFNGSMTVKLSQYESIISLLKEEEQIQGVYEAFERIIFDDNTSDSDGDEVFKRYGLDDELDEKVGEFKSIESIQEDSDSVINKLYFVYKSQVQTFGAIKESFVEIFPHVEDIRIEPIHNGHFNKKIPHFIRNAPFIQIKEKNVEHWIDSSKISSGMYRTLMHIAELYLCADDSVILIDEFENSLGVNCIEQISSSIAASERNLQFIITSHHPYIINNINYSNWKLVTRQGSVVKAEDAEKYGIGKSKHQAFTQLMNLDAYSEGIAS